MELTRTRLDRWISEHDVQVTPEAIGDLMVIANESPGTQFVDALVEAAHVLAMYEVARQEPAALSCWREARRRALDGVTQFSNHNDRDVHDRALQA